MNKDEKEETLTILRKSLIRLTEIQALMKDGKIIVAYEKLGGLIKILGAFGAKIESTPEE